MAQTGSNGWFQPDSVFGANRREVCGMGEAAITCAILMPS